MSKIRNSIREMIRDLYESASEEKIRELDAIFKKYYPRKRSSIKRRVEKKTDECPIHAKLVKKVERRIACLKIDKDTVRQERRWRELSNAQRKKWARDRGEQ